MDGFYDELETLLDGGNNDAVEAFILRAVSSSPEGSRERAALYNELAGFYRGINRQIDAENAFLESLELFEALDMVSSPEYVTVATNLSGLYRMKSEVDKAILLFRNAMKKVDNADEQSSYSYISILNNLALAHQEKGEFGEALEYAENALALLRDGHGTAHEIAASLNNLAAIRIKLNEYDEADRLINESLSLYGTMQETDIHIAAALTTKAVVQCRTGDYSGALEGFRRSLGFIGNFFGENAEFAICKRNIANVCELLGDLPAAIAELTDSARIMERILGMDNQTVEELHEKIRQLESRNTENNSDI